MNKLLSILLGILLIVSIIQTLQLNAMANEIKNQEEKIVLLEANAKRLSEMNITIGTGGGSGGSLTIEKLKDLPNMVGGC